MIRTITEDPVLVSKGARWWTTEDTGGAPTLSKSNLGLFFYHAIKEGAQIGDIHAFNHNYDRSTVHVALFMTDEIKERIEAETKYRFRRPSRIRLNTAPPEFQK